MKKTIAASLLFAPVMMFAQQSKTVATLEAPAPISADTPVKKSISTGVKAPKRIDNTGISLLPASLAALRDSTSTVVLHYVVDEKGLPTNIEVVKSVNPMIDGQVVSAVSQYRYVPGQLDGQPAAVPVDLQVTLQR